MLASGVRCAMPDSVMLVLSHGVVVWVGTRACLNSTEVDRCEGSTCSPQLGSVHTLVPGQLQRSPVTAHRQPDSVLVQAAVDHLAELLAEAGVFQGRLPTSICCKALQQRLQKVHTVAELCDEVLAVEGAVSLLGSGPRGQPSSIPNKQPNKLFATKKLVFPKFVKIFDS